MIQKRTDANRNQNSDTSNSCTRKRDRAAYMRQYRQNNNSPYKKLKATEQQRKYRQMTTSPQKKSKRNEYQKKYRECTSSNNLSIEFAIKQFHEIVNQGPLYVCTCML